MKTNIISRITGFFQACLLGLALTLSLSSCVTTEAEPPPQPKVPRPLASDKNEVKWRMYYEDQYATMKNAAPPGTGDPDVAWTAYYAEKQAFAINENNRLLKKQLELQENSD